MQPEANAFGCMNIAQEYLNESDECLSKYTLQKQFVRPIHFLTRQVLTLVEQALHRAEEDAHALVSC